MSKLINILPGSKEFHKILLYIKNWIYHIKNRGLTILDLFLSKHVIKSDEFSIIQYKNIFGTIHRRNGPAYQSWHRNGIKASEEFYINGKRHRVNAPAYIGWGTNGVKSSCFYFKNNFYYNLNNPSRICYNPLSGKIINKQYCINYKYHTIINSPSSKEGWVL